jgi:hypothetical protein
MRSVYGTKDFEILEGGRFFAGIPKIASME